jgi:hypothetical protein
MLFRTIKPQVVDTPVIVVDALGISDIIRRSSKEALLALGARLDRHYYRFRASIPFGIVITTPTKVFGTTDFSTFRLNDMFVVYSRDPKSDLTMRYLITSSLVYQALMLDGFVPRGGLGFGSVLCSKDTIVGNGFLDAYETAEKRPETIKDVCAIQLSPAFLNTVPNTEKAYRLLCFYEGAFFINPTYLTDPILGRFDKPKISELLHVAGANDAKLRATEKFLDELEDYDAALQPSSKSAQWITAHRHAHSDTP